MVRLRQYDVKLIRLKYEKEKINSKYEGKTRMLIEDLAEEYRVKPSSVYRIVTRKTWKHL